MVFTYMPYLTTSARRSHYLDRPSYDRSASARIKRSVKNKTKCEINLNDPDDKQAQSYVVSSSVLKPSTNICTMISEMTSKPRAMSSVQVCKDRALILYSEIQTISKPRAISSVQAVQHNSIGPR